jgi:hypothetical protein
MLALMTARRTTWMHSDWAAVSPLSGSLTRWSSIVSAESDAHDALVVRAVPLSSPRAGTISSPSTRRCGSCRQTAKAGQSNSGETGEPYTPGGTITTIVSNGWR